MSRSEDLTFTVKRLFAVVVLALFLCTGCGGGGNSTSTQPPATPAVAPSITSQPQSQAVTAPSPATFSVTATGTDPLAYQWSKNGTAISAATAATYTTPATTTDDNNGRFTVTVSNSAGSVTSSAAILTVQAPAPVPSFTLTPPPSATIQSGTSASITVTATRINGHTATITLKIVGNQQGISGSGTIASGSSTGTLTVTAPLGLAAGDYPLQLYGTDGTLGVSASFSTAVTANYLYLYPYNLHLSAQETSSSPLRVIDSNGNPVPVTPTFSGYDSSLISISSDGHVTGLRQENDTETGTWVTATIAGLPISNRSVVRVLSKDYSVPFSLVETPKSAWYYPSSVGTEVMDTYFSQYQVSLVTDYAYGIEGSLLGTNPFAGARQIYEVDFGETETQRVCGISGNPIRLGWNISDNAWKNCFLVPIFPPRSPQWFVFYHEMGHNFTLASSTFVKGISGPYIESGASYVAMISMKKILDDPVSYPLNVDASNSLQNGYSSSANLFQTGFNSWLSSGATFTDINPDIEDGICLFYESQRPSDFGIRFYLPLQPKYASRIGNLFNNLSTADQHTVFAALVSAAVGNDLSQTFQNQYHYPINSSLFTSAYSAFTNILANP